MYHKTAKENRLEWFGHRPSRITPGVNECRRRSRPFVPAALATLMLVASFANSSAAAGTDEDDTLWLEEAETLTEGLRGLFGDVALSVPNYRDNIAREPESSTSLMIDAIPLLVARDQNLTKPLSGTVSLRELGMSDETVRQIAAFWEQQNSIGYDQLLKTATEGRTTTQYVSAKRLKPAAEIRPVHAEIFQRARQVAYSNEAGHEGIFPLRVELARSLEVGPSESRGMGYTNAVAQLHPKHILKLFAIGDRDRLKAQVDYRIDDERLIVDRYDVPYDVANARAEAAVAFSALGGVLSEIARTPAGKMEVHVPIAAAGSGLLREQLTKRDYIPSPVIFPAQHYEFASRPADAAQHRIGQLSWAGFELDLGSLETLTAGKPGWVKLIYRGSAYTKELRERAVAKKQWREQAGPRAHWPREPREIAPAARARIGPFERPQLRLPAAGSRPATEHKLPHAPRMNGGLNYLGARPWKLKSVVRRD